MNRFLTGDVALASINSLMYLLCFFLFVFMFALFYYRCHKVLLGINILHVDIVVNT